MKIKPDQKTLNRFWKRIKKTDTCWLCDRPQNGTEYCQFKYQGKLVLVHRFSYELIKRKIPKGLSIDHLCRVRNCVNPDHLEAVTQQVNDLRGNTVAAKNTKKTHCPAGHPYQGKNLYLYEYKPKRYLRFCRSCGRERMRIRVNLIKKI